MEQSTHLHAKERNLLGMRHTNARAPTRTHLGACSALDVLFLHGVATSQPQRGIGPTTTKILPTTVGRETTKKELTVLRGTCCCPAAAAVLLLPHLLLKLLVPRAQGADLADAEDRGASRPSERAVNSTARMSNDPEERYGVTDYRTIKPWVFAARVLLRPKRRARMSIGTLHVKVVEARGLMARDGVLGRSDPYVNLDLSGRYLSNGQEWSEQFRIKEHTRVVKYSLNPVWNESFSLPVRRAGAFLRVELWDWDRGVADDPLGSFEVKIGEELLSQKAMDMWFVLGTPRDLKNSRSPSPGAQANRKTEQQQPSEVEEEIIEEEETAEMLAAASTNPNRSTGWSAALGKRYKYQSKSKSPDGGGGVLSLEHDHSPGEESDVCEACIQYRRDNFGEVRLELRFEFNEFGETCSHIWPEEPPKPVETTFSPNRVYYNALLLQQLARPYLRCMQEASATVHWVHPWKSLVWFIALVVMLLRPCLLIVVINMSLAWSVVNAYIEYTFIFVPPEEAVGDVESSNSAGTSRLRRRSSSNRSVKVPKKSLLPPIDEPGDEELEAMYRTVRGTKKLPVVVEEIGKRTFAVDALPAQRQVETIGRVLMKVRRRLRPVNIKSLVLAVVALFGNMVLQLWLYRKSRFNLYLLGCCCGVFAYNFYAWRGRAFIAGIKEAVRCRQLRASLANTGINTAPNATSTSSSATNGLAGTTSSEEARLTGGVGRQSSGKEDVDNQTALGGPVFAPPGATPATNEHSTSSIQNIAQSALDNDSGRGPRKGEVSAAATSTMEKGRKIRSTGTKKDGARETLARPAKRKNVRFEEGTVGGEKPRIPLLRPLGGTTRVSPVVGKPPQGRDLWKLGKERRTWMGSRSSGAPTYGSIDDISSDEEREGGNWDEEMGGAPAARGISTTPRWSFHGDISMRSSTPGNGDGGGGGGPQSDAQLTKGYESDDSPPRGRRGWRSRVSKWYHDF